jgi:hypothetical protein
MHKRSLWTAFLFVLLVPSAGRAEVAIPLDCRVRNLPGERCGWCALETLARFHQIEDLYHLADKRTGRASPEDLEATLDEANVNYRVQDIGCRNKAILHYAVREKLVPCHFSNEG